MPNTSLKQVIEEVSMLTGVGVCPRSLEQPYLSVLLKNRNLLQTWQLTSGYKLFDTWKGPGCYDFSVRDNFLDKIPPDVKNRMGCIVWRYQWGGCLSRFPTYEQRWEQLEKWLRRLLSPEPWAIDAVNEIFGPDGQILNKFENLLGADWVYRLFRLVADICPNSRLFVCQNFLRNDRIWDSVRSLVWDIRKKGININVAIQAQSTIQASLNYGWVLEKRLKELHNLCDIHVSEVTCWIWRWNKGRFSPGLRPHLKKIQQETYCNWLRVSQGYGVEQFAFWSPFDALSWHLYYDDELGIFDKNLEWWSY